MYLSWSVWSNVSSFFTCVLTEFSYCFQWGIIPPSINEFIRYDYIFSALDFLIEILGLTTEKLHLYLYFQRMHGTDSVKCDECEMTFKHPNALATHMKSVHTYSTCELCGESIRSISMKTHKIQKHTDLLDMPYICRVCDPPRGFAKRIVYEDHTNIHVSRAITWVIKLHLETF